jgi:acylphosphatase
MKSIVARHVFVQGRVQGVAFRWYARERADELGVCGWIRNLSDGRVEAWLEGPATAVADMERWLGVGPPAARVRGVQARDADPKDLAGFEVARGGF